MLKGPHESCDLDLIERIAGDDRKGAILFEDAVYSSVFPKKAEDLKARVDEVFVISDDLKARGVDDRLIEGFQVVDYPRAVDIIMEEYDQTVTL
jgi:sulfur relay protein TusB/DsrH